MSIKMNTGLRDSRGQGVECRSRKAPEGSRIQGFECKSADVKSTKEQKSRSGKRGWRVQGETTAKSERGLINESRGSSARICSHLWIRYNSDWLFDEEVV